MSVLVEDIICFFDKWAPPETMMSYDNVGLLVGDKQANVERVMVCLDITHEVINDAINNSCELIISHHPIIFRKLSTITKQSFIGKMLFDIIKHDINVFCAHTNLDQAIEGVSYCLAEKLGLSSLRFLERLDDKKSQYGMGVIGELSTAMTMNDILCYLKEKLNINSMRYSGMVKGDIQKMAVCGGAGASLIAKAKSEGAQVYITSDLNYHDFFDTSDHFMVIDIGHYQSEHYIIDKIVTLLKKEFNQLRIQKTIKNTNPIRYYN